MKKIIKNTILIIGITLAVALLLILVGNQMKANAVKEKQAQEDYSEWLSKNCTCLEYNIPFCLGGYELKNNACFNGEGYTTVLEACSEYNCSGEIKLRINETDTWEDKK